MNPASATLKLKDIHLPTSIAWWPPAPGWWLLLVLVLLLLVLGIFLYRRHRRRRLYRIASRELAAIEEDYAQTGDERQLVKALSVWLRRVSLSFYPRVDVAGLTSREWLEFLDSRLAGDKQTRRFSDGPGQALISAPYQPAPRVNVDELLAVCQSWLKNLPPRPQVQQP